MPLPLVANTAKATIRSLVDGQTMINDLSFRNEVSGSSDPIELGNLALALQNWYTASIIPLLSEDVVYGVTRVRDLSTDPGFEAEVSGSSVGGVASEAAPNNVCAVPSFRTGVAGRSFRGRNYISGIPNSDISINVLSGDLVLAIIDAYGQLLPGGSVLPTNWEWVVVSYFTGGALRPVGLTSAITSVIFTDTVVDSQRRRLPGRGK